MAKRILIIVDEEALVKWLPRHFEAQGVRVFQTSDDEEAVEHAKSAPDFVIIDLVLANRDSFALIQEIKLAAPNTFLVCISARAGTVARRKALAIGADAYLAKPWTLVELDSLIINATGSNQSGSDESGIKGKRKGQSA